MYFSSSNPSSLTSGISKKYKNHFLLDEDSLRRISGLLEEYAKSLNTKYRVYYRVRREDDRYFESEQISDVLADPNITGKLIQEIEVFLSKWIEKTEKREGYFYNIVSIRFKSTDKEYSFNDNQTNLIISSEDTNWALVLADKLEPQIIRTFKKSRIPKWLFLVYWIPIIIILFKKVSDLTLDPVPYIIPLILIIPAIIIYYSDWRRYPKWIINITGPESVFYWGEYKNEYDHRLKIRDNFFWVVIIGFIVSIISSVFVAFF
jgi:hypothetical protein